MWQKNARYLDYNAGSGLALPVRKKLIEILAEDPLAGGFFLANASSQHRLGQKVQHHLHQAHLKVASSLSAQPEDLIFTSSGTEANQTVIRSCLQEVEGVVIGSGEHSASFDFLAETKRICPDLSFVHSLPLSLTGNYDFTALQILLEEAQRKGLKKIFLSLFWANNEIGVVNDLNQLSALLEDSKVEVVLHLDAAQAWGKIPVNLSTCPAHFVTFSAHKIGAPAGSGLLWVRPKTALHPLFLGEQSRGRRGGTENVLGMIAVGVAAESLNVAAFQHHTRVLRDRLEAGLLEAGLPIRFWGRDSERVPNTSRFSFKEFSNYQNWIELLDLRGFAVSNGSACHSKIVEPSRILTLLGATRGEALNSIRVSFGPQNTLEDVEELIAALVQIYEQKTQTSRTL